TMKLLAGMALMPLSWLVAAATSAIMLPLPPGEKLLAAFATLIIAPLTGASALFCIERVAFFLKKKKKQQQKLQLRNELRDNRLKSLREERESLAKQMLRLVELTEESVPHP
ncbi:MAG: hypothetical protein MK135_12535, partial [Polyangiaceae bacterium]|nr:hypothetical protein [Polyangiaceae bacterium]